MRIGYARLSPQDQNLNLQREALTKAREMLREGGTLVVKKHDRLGRNVKQLVDLVGELPHAKNGRSVHISTQVQPH